MPIALYDKAKNRRLFEITSAQRDQFIAVLEEESTKDHDYYIDADVLDFLTGKVDEVVLAQLRPLVGAVTPVESATVDETVDVTGESADADLVETDAAPGGFDIEWREEK